MLAAAVAHTPEAEEVLRGARTRLSRKPGALSRELLRNWGIVYAGNLIGAAAMAPSLAATARAALAQGNLARVRQLAQVHFSDGEDLFEHLKSFVLLTIRWPRLV